MWQSVLGIRIHLAVLDPDPYWGSREADPEIDQDLQVILVSCLSKRLLYLRRYRYVFGLITYLTAYLLYFSCKNSTFCVF